MTIKVNISTDPETHVQQVSEAVAKRLREVRKQQKISLDELARRSGVSKGMVVEIENCKANPSIGILCKISAALGLSVADVVNVASTPTARLLRRRRSQRSGMGLKVAQPAYSQAPAGPT